jgi:hypothetical protein
MNQTLIRFIEAFVAVFVVTFAADAIFASGSVDLFGPGALEAIATAAASAALIAIRRVLATQGPQP